MSKAALARRRGSARWLPAAAWRAVVWLLLGAVLLGLGAEAFLRLRPSALPEVAQLQRHWLELFDAGMNVEDDPFLGFTYPKSYQGEIRRGDFHFVYTTDEHGFRNPSPWPERADIVLLGDSHGFAYGVDDGAAWPRLIDAGLQDRSLINLSMIAASTQQAARTFAKFGAPLEPKLTILALFPAFALVAADDFASWLRAGQPGSYADWRFGDHNLRLSQRVIKWLVQHSYALLYLRHWVGGLVGESWPGQTMAFADGSRLQFAPAVYASNAARARPGHPDFLAVIDEVEGIGRAVAAAGSAFLVVLVPTKEAVYLPLLGADVPEAMAPFEAALAERGIDLLDLTPPLQERAKVGERLFFEIDIHPNVSGNRVIADVILDHLRARAEQYGLTDR